LHNKHSLRNFDMACIIQITHLAWLADMAD